MLTQREPGAVLAIRIAVLVYNFAVVAKYLANPAKARAATNTFLSKRNLLSPWYGNGIRVRKQKGSKAHLVFT